jgi:hypothetical protein
MEMGMIGSQMGGANGDAVRKRERKERKHSLVEEGVVALLMHWFPWWQVVVVVVVTVVVVRGMTNKFVVRCEV